MAPDLSRFSTEQHPDEATALLLQPRQAIYGSGHFAYAHGFEIHDSQFYDIHHQSGKTEFDRLQKFISEDAFYDSKARYPPPRCYPGTRVEVLKIITDWIDNPDPRKQILWLNAPAGAGKSAISQTIAEHCKDTQLAASFFFQRDTSDRGVADRMFLTLAWQLARSIPDICPYLESTLKAERNIHTKSIDVQFDLLFVQLFEKLLRDKPGLRPQKTLVIIDALDECATDQDQKTILALIGAKMPKRVPLRFLISSRPEPHIEETFDTNIMKSATSTLVLNDEVAPDNDIRKYLKDELSRIFEKRRISPPTSDVIRHLVVQASGQFIYASTVVKFVDDDDHDPEKRLNIILGTRRTTSSPYAQLDQLYNQILSQQKHIWLLRIVFLYILAFGQIDFDRPPPLLVAIKEEDLKLKLRRMRSLLHISDSIIRPYHLSLLDFLEDRKRAGKYHVFPLFVGIACVPKALTRLPHSVPIVVGFMVIYTGLSILYLIAYWVWAKTATEQFKLWIVCQPVQIVVLISVLLWIRRRERKALIRGLLAEPTA